jgi:HlyD family secretion protein
MPEGPSGEQPSQPSQSPPAPRRRFSRSVVPLILLAGITVAAFLVWKVFLAAPRIPDNIITLSGRIEGDDSAIAPKTGGRILEIRVREGDSVEAGDTIAVLDDAQVLAREDQAQAALLDADASAKAAARQIDVLQEQLRQNQLETKQAQMDATGRVRQAHAELAAAEADLAQQEASYQIAEFDKEAYSRLARTGAASERQGKQAASTAAERAAAVAAAKKRVEAARGALTVAEAVRGNEGIRGAATAAVQRQVAQQQAVAASATARAKEAVGRLREAEANRKDLIVMAPFSGTVTTRAAEPGEVVQAGTTLVTLLDLGKVYLRGFIPEAQIGRVKVGQSARVYLDSNPKEPIDANVMRIDPQVTFTPENTYFRDERVKQVVGVKLLLLGAKGFAKPGMPADGEILVQGDVWPEGWTRK